MPKRTVRVETLARRRQLSLQQVSALSLALQRNFLALPEFRRAASIALYAPVHHEVETALAASEALASGKRLLYPAVVGDNLAFREVKALQDLAPGRFGIPEPAGEAFDPAAVDLVVVPGVAFDIFGRRIGYGKGFYDRALHTLEKSGKLVGFCYDFQLIEEIIGEPHDVTMDLVVTEVKVVRMNTNIYEGD